LGGRQVLGLTRRGGLIHVLRDTLSSLGFVFQTEPMVDTVLQEAGRNHPAAIVLDMLGKGMLLGETLRQLRTYKDTRTVPILPVAFSDDGRSGLVLGPVEFLKQPFTAEEFSQSLKGLESWITYKEALVIDADPEAGARWSTFLAEEGFETTTATGGEEGIRHLENLLPGLIVLNLNLPPSDSVRVTAFVRSQGEMLTVPLFFLLPIDLGPTSELILQEQFRQTLNTNKFPLANFIRQLKRYFSHIATETG